jgi:hypothetical protein
VGGKSGEGPELWEFAFPLAQGAPADELGRRFSYAAPGLAGLLESACDNLAWKSRKHRLHAMR